MSTRVSRGFIAIAISFSLLFGTAVLLAADEQVPVLFRQGALQGKIFPLVGTSTAEEFYNYSALDYKSQTSLEIPRHGIVFLYRELRTDKLALIIILNAPNAGPAGQVRFTIQGLPASAELTLQDDANDEYTFNPPDAQFTWRWTSGHTDGFVINNLTEPFTLTMTPEIAQGLSGWKLLTLKNPVIGPERVPLPSLAEPITLWVGEGQIPQAAFHHSPEQAYSQIPVLFDARPSQVLYGQIIKYEWDFNGDGVFDVTTDQPLVTQIFAQSGTLTITLRVTDVNGFTNTVSQSIEVREQKTGVWRTISTPEVQPGGVFRVTIRFSIDIPTNGLGVEEQWPVGWTIEPVRNDGAVFKFTHSNGQWIFPALLKIGESKTVVYDVRVPPVEEVPGPPLPAKFSVQGAITSVSPAYVVPIGGESEVEVVSCLSVPVAIAHLDLLSGEVDLRSSEMISKEQLTRALDSWANRAVIPGTCDAPLTSDALLKVMLYQVRDISVDQPLAGLANAGAPPSATVTRTITSQLPAGQVYLKSEGAHVIQVELTITANGDLPGVLISEQLPEGWKVQSKALENALFRTDTNEWILAELIPAGQTRHVSYEVILPPGAEKGMLELKGSVESGQANALTPIQGDSEIQFVDCLSVPAAIAHLKVETGELDLSLDNIISREQSEAAFMLWFQEKEVPGTCGQKLDLATLQLITNYMLTGTPVEK